MRLCLAILLMSISLIAKAQSNPIYDKALADSLGSDEYGMKMYVFVILKTGPTKIDRKETVDSLFKGHMENIGHLAKAGKLVVAGPMKRNDNNYRGIFILNAKDLEEGKQLLSTDPAIKAKLLDAEIYQWYGSAALPTYLPNHDKIEKNKH